MPRTALKEPPVKPENLKPAIAPEKRKEPVKKILVKDLQLSEYAHGRFSVVLPQGWTFEETLKPEFWANVAHILAPNPNAGNKPYTGSIIEIRTQDHAFYAELYVRGVQKQALIVQTIREPVLFGQDVARASKHFKTRWNVQKNGFDVIRISDNEIILDASALPTQELAQEAISKLMTG